MLESLQEVTNCRGSHMLNWESKTFLIPKYLLLTSNIITVPPHLVLLKSINVCMFPLLLHT